MKVILIILTLSFNILANDCLNQKDEMGFKWASGPIRKQGGGWIWFTGKGKAPSSYLSEDISIGQALERFKQECKSINQKIRIHESCTEKEDETYTSYSRISIKDRYCQSGVEEENTTLVKKHKLFKRYVKKQVNRLNKKKDYLNSYYNESNNSEINKHLKFQITYIKNKIRVLNQNQNKLLNFFSDKSEDFITPKNLSEVKDVINLYNSRRYGWKQKMIWSKKLCSTKNPVACYVYFRSKLWHVGTTYKKAISYSDIKLVEKSCTDGYGPSCVILGRYSREFSYAYNKRNIIKELVKYCQTHTPVKNIEEANSDPCYSLSILYDEDNERRFEYEKISCKYMSNVKNVLGLNSCRSYGISHLDSKKENPIFGWIVKEKALKRALFFFKEQCVNEADCFYYNLLKDPICFLGYCFRN